MPEEQTHLRIGYMVTAYHEQRHLRRLLTTLLRWDPTGEIALHFDRSKASLDLGGLVDERLHVLSEWSPVTWGDSSYLEVLLHGLRWWSRQKVDWVVVLSGQDYPVRPVDELQEFLAASAKNAFIFGGKIGVPPSRYRVVDLDTVRQRYFLHWAKFPRVAWTPLARPITQRGVRLARHLVPGGLLVRELPHNERPWIGWRPVRKHPFTEEWQCCFGWDYFAVDQRAISILVSDDDRVRALRRWYKRSIIPTESFFITVMRGHPRVRCAKALHYVQWENFGDPHPVVLAEDCYDLMRSSGCFFARKFDSSSSSLLDRIDQEMLEIPSETRR